MDAVCLSKTSLFNTFTESYGTDLFLSTPIQSIHRAGQLAHQDVLLRLNSLLSANVTKGENSNNLNITLSLSPNSKKDEGDFDSVALALSFSLAASQMVAEKKESSPFQLMSTNYAVISELLSRTDGKGFAVDYYAPFFAELDKREFVEALVYHAFTSARFPGATEWAEQNAAKLTDFQRWLSAYRWPSKK